MQSLWLVVLAALAVPIPAAAAVLGQAQAVQPAPKKICKTFTMTGSRLATKRVCGTAEEWAERRLQDRQAIEKVQVQPCVIQSTGRTGRSSC